MFWKRKKLRVYLTENKVKFVLAFEHGGHKYYQLENAFDMTAGRGLMAMTYYQEFQMRCDIEYLKKHVKAIDILLEQKTVKIIQLAEIHRNLRDRLDLAPFPDHIYKLASVLFYDETEDYRFYDSAYNLKKIAAWRADPDMLPFLVQAPLKNLMPFGDMPKENLATYFTVLEGMNRMHHEQMSAALSKVQ